MTDCTCKNINIGMTVTASRNLDEHCPEHGIGTDYYEEHVVPQWERAVDLQRQAREARNAYIEKGS